MKRLFTFFTLLYCYACPGQGYDYNEVWAFADSTGIDFNTVPPTGIYTSIKGYEGTASVSDAAGQLLFYTDGRTVWDRNHMLMPNGSLLMPNAPLSTTTQQAAITSVPGSANEYYLFSLSDSYGKYLYYSRVSMTLNGGFGDVIMGQKAIVMDSTLTEKMLAVPGDNCDIWLIVRSVAGVYKAYHITNTGIDPSPVLSAVGAGNVYSFGYLIASPDRNRIAACNGGAELYDFDANTGIISNPFQIPALPFGNYYGLCFSPDNTKLYAASVTAGIEQFDLSLATQADIIASRTTISGNISRAIRLGPDGKIYIPKEISDTMRCIEYPNLAGTACTYNSNALLLPPGRINKIGLPNYNAIIHADTVHNLYVHYLCQDSVQLSPFNSGVNYLWENGSTDPERKVTLPGTYVLRYRFLCSSFTDTFRVLPKPPFPQVGSVGVSCIGQQNGYVTLTQPGGDTTTYSYTWYDSGGNVLYQHASASGSQLGGVTQGDYQVLVSTADGCDTLIQVTIQELATPEAGFEAGTAYCAGTPVHFNNTTTGPASQFSWDFGDQEYSSLTHPDHIYSQAGTYRVTLIAANSSCSDTFALDIQVHSFDLGLTADKAVVDFKEPFTLQTAAAEPYFITAWMPQALFPDQQALSQSRQGDTTLTYMVSGYSAANQCPDTASLKVVVNPFINLPSAFSPNGDGLNDYFAPVFWGSQPLIKRFMIYDRWGKKVWSGTGQQALRGWDGRYPDGAKANTGTYYWYLELSAPLRGKRSFKGDLSLVR